MVKKIQTYFLLMTKCETGRKQAIPQNDISYDRYLIKAGEDG